jgi:hypothetical protein
MIETLSHQRATMTNRLHEPHRTLREAEVCVRREKKRYCKVGAF